MPYETRLTIFCERNILDFSAALTHQHYLDIDRNNSRDTVMSYITLTKLGIALAVIGFYTMMLYI